MAVNDLIQKIENAKRKREQYDQQVRLLSNRYSAIKRKEDTRKKILIGAYVTERLKEAGELHLGGAQSLKDQLSTFLTRKADRELFNLDT